MPGFSYFLGSVNTTCNKKGYITVLSNLKSAGLPEKATKIVLYKYTVVDGNAAYRPLKEETNPTSIIESHTFTELESGSYAIRYYYNGTSDYVQGINIGETSNLSLQLNFYGLQLEGVFLRLRLASIRPNRVQRCVWLSRARTAPNSSMAKFLPMHLITSMCVNRMVLLLPKQRW